MEAKHVAGFATRYNMREEDTQAMMAKAAEMMEGKRITYKALIADNVLESGARS